MSMLLSVATPPHFPSFFFFFFHNPKRDNKKPNYLWDSSYPELLYAFLLDIPLTYPIIGITFLPCLFIEGGQEPMRGRIKLRGEDYGKKNVIFFSYNFTHFLGNSEKKKKKRGAFEEYQFWEYENQKKTASLFRTEWCLPFFFVFFFLPPLCFCYYLSFFFLFYFCCFSFLFPFSFRPFLFF